MDKFSSPEYKRSRIAYTVQCALEYFVALLAADAYLASLLSSIGISDSLVGIISSFTTLAFVIQLMSIFILQMKINIKKTVIFFDTLSIFFFMFMYLIPFLPVGKGLKTLLVIISILMAYAGKYLIFSICFKWANSYVESSKRGDFSAVKEMISLLGGMIFTVIMGFVFDKFESLGNIEGGFLFAAASILVLNICNFISLSLIKAENEEKVQEKSEPFSVILKNTFGNKNFRSVIYLTILWDIARYFTIGFLGIFKYKDLMMSVFLVQVINIISNFARLAISRPLGRYSDRTSYAKGFKLGLYLAAGSFLINAFTTKSTWFFVIIHTLLYNCSMAGTEQNSYNIAYSYVNEKYIVQAMSIKNCIGGLCGFGASILGGKILDLVQGNNNMIFGLHIYGQQLLSLISFAIIMVIIVYIRKVIEKQEIMIQ